MHSHNSLCVWLWAVGGPNDESDQVKLKRHCPRRCCRRQPARSRPARHRELKAPLPPSGLHHQIITLSNSHHHSRAQVLLPDRNVFMIISSLSPAYSSPHMHAPREEGFKLGSHRCSSVCVSCLIHLNLIIISLSLSLSGAKQSNKRTIRSIGPWMMATQQAGSRSY